MSPAPPTTLLRDPFAHSVRRCGHSLRTPHATPAATLNSKTIGGAGTDFTFAELLAIFAFVTSRWTVGFFVPSTLVDFAVVRSLRLLTDEAPSRFTASPRMVVKKAHDISFFIRSPQKAVGPSPTATRLSSSTDSAISARLGRASAVRLRTNEHTSDYYDVDFLFVLNPAARGEGCNATRCPGRP